MHPALRRTFWLVVSSLLLLTAGHAASFKVTPRELLRIPFGDARETLGARVEGGNFLIPRDFTMDGVGHFYIFDTTKHRIARYSFEGVYEIAFRYPETARQIFAHADSRQNVWLLISDPMRGIFYGVYDPHGKPLHSGIFSHYNQFRLHLDDAYTLHVILSSDQDPSAQGTFLFDEPSLLLKKENIAPPPETHHQVRTSDQVFFIDQVPGGQNNATPLNRITDAAHRSVADIPGTVVYVTQRGEVYARVGPREIDVYEVNGTRKGKILLQGLRSACESIRFDADGTIYELDGIPDVTDDQLRHRTPPVDPHADWEDLHYSPSMPGMRLLIYERPGS